MKLKVFMSLLMFFCLSIITVGTALADSNNLILEKQKEIDYYIFEEHSAEIAEKGITVTHTSPLDHAVEIGITPFNQENANYFYDIFGKETVKVVEGIQATTMTTGLTNTDVLPMEMSVSSEKDKNANSIILPAIALVIIAIGALFAIRLSKKVDIKLRKAK